MTLQQATATLDPHTARFEKAQDTLPGNQAEWVRELRQDAIHAYQAMGWPTTNDEAWKYTSLKPVRELDLAAPEEATRDTVDADALAEYTLETDTLQLVVVNGEIDPALSDLDAAPDGVTLSSLADVLDDEPHRLEDALAQHADWREDAFCALNTATFTDGVFLDVPDGTVLDTPVHILYVSTSQDHSILTAPRTLVTMGETSEADVIETCLTLGDAPCLTNAVTEVHAGPNATLRHIKLQREAEDTHHVWTFQATQERDSTVRSHNLIFGGHITRNNVFNRLAGDGCDTVLNGLYMGTEDQHIDNYTQIRHEEPHGTSHQLYKGVLDDASRGVFRGTIYVAPGAQKTDGYQHNPNMLLSRDAVANSVPQLEIFADDVKCSHGSTTGEMDDEWIFYLQTRGIDAESARNLLVYAFAGEVLDMIEVDAVRELATDLVLERLPQGRVVRDAV